MENMIECARSFRNTPDILFVIVGSGEGEQGLKASVKKSDLNNVLFFPLQTYDNLSALLAIADLHLILLKRIASDLVMPSKLTSVLAAGGVPVVTAAKHSNIYGIVENNELGIVVEPDDINALIRGISKGLQMDLRFFSNNARAYAENYLSKRSVLLQWERKIINLARHYRQPYNYKRPAITTVINKNLEAGVRNV